MKDLTNLKREINNQLGTINEKRRTHKLLLQTIAGEVTTLKKVKAKWLSGIIKQSVYQNYKAKTTAERNNLHLQVVCVKRSIAGACEGLKKLQAEHATALKEATETAKNNMFTRGKAILEGLDDIDRACLEQYMLSKSYARTN